MKLDKLINVANPLKGLYNHISNLFKNGSTKDDDEMVDGRLNLVDRVCQQPNSELVSRLTCKLMD